ncbi:MAG: CpaF family protein [Coriobacteriaceae bacterium]|nr:CpaF family protein [Coriobacteriaceae bacterium]
MLSREYDASARAITARLAAALTSGISDGATVSDSEDPMYEQAIAEVASDPRLSALSRDEMEAAARFCVDDLFNLGPIESLLRDDDITEIMVNGPDQVLVEKRGKIVDSGVHFYDDEHIERIITKIVTTDNRRCDANAPMCDCRLRRPGASFDGSRVNAVWKPIAVDHPLLDIRKFRNDMLTIDSLIDMGSMDERCAEILQALVRSRMNIIVCGGTGTGKTTLLNAISNFIPDDSRIITVEDTAELNLAKEHVVRMEARQPNTEGVGEITIRQLVKNTLRQRPDRIVVGECRGAEAFDMLQAMGSGHDGSLTTLHANEPRQAISRLQMCIQMSPEGAQMPPSGILRIIADSVDFIVQIKRFPDGSRRLVSISEICGMQGDVVTMGEIMRFAQDHERDESGRITGRWVPGGDRFCESHLTRCENLGVEVKDEWFRDTRRW